MKKMRNVRVKTTSLNGLENMFYEVPKYFRCGTMLYNVIAPDEVMTCDIMGKAHFCIEQSITEVEYKSIQPISSELFEKTFVKHFQQLLPYATREERIKEHDAELLRKASRLHFTEAGLAYQYAQQAYQPEVRAKILNISSILYRRYEFINHEL